MLGIDIQDENIYIASEKKGRAVGCRRLELPDDLVRKGRILSFDALADFLREEKCGRGGASVILPTQEVYARNIDVPVMNAKQLAFNLPYEFRDYLTLDKEKYFYDYAVREVDEENDSMKLYAVCTEKDLIKSYREMLKRAGLKLSCAINRSAALGAVLYVRGEDGDRCFISLDYDATLFDIYRSFCPVQTKSSGVCIQNIDERIADICDVDLHIAYEYRKSNYEDVLAKPELRELYSQIAIEILRAVNFYNYNNQSDSLKEIYLIGEGAINPYLVQTIKDETGLGVLDTSGFIDMENGALYVAAFGAALCGRIKI